MSDDLRQVRQMLERGAIHEAVALVDGRGGIALADRDRHRRLQHAELQARDLELEHAAEVFAIKRAFSIVCNPDGWAEARVLVPVVLGSCPYSWPAGIERMLADDGPPALVASRHCLFGVHSAMLGDLDRAVTALQRALFVGRDASVQKEFPLAFSLSEAARVLARCRADRGEDPSTDSDADPPAAQQRLELQIEMRLMRAEYSAARAAMAKLEQLPIEPAARQRLDHWRTFEGIAVGRWTLVKEQLSKRYAGDLRLQILQALQVQYGALLHRHQPSTRELLAATYDDIQPLQLRRDDWQTAHELRRWLAALQHDVVLQASGLRARDADVWRVDGTNACCVAEATELAQHAATPSIRVLARLVVQMARAAGFPAAVDSDDDIDTLCSDLVHNGLLVEALACAMLAPSPQVDTIDRLRLRVASLQQDGDQLRYLLNNSTEHDRGRNASLDAHREWRQRFRRRRWPAPAWIEERMTARHVRHSVPAMAGAAQRRLRPGEAIVWYTVTDDRVAAAVLTSRRMRLLDPVSVPRPALWEALLAKHSDVSVNGEIRAGSPSLEAMLGIDAIAALLAWEDVARIYVAGDPPIGLVPFPALALHPQGMDANPPTALIERFEIAALRPVAGPRFRWPFQRSGTSLAVVADTVAGHELRDRQRELDAAVALAEAVGGARCVELAGGGAVWPAVREVIGDAAWLHVYAHGQSHTGDLADAALLLADGWLHASTIAQCDLTRLRLAFLSSCWVGDQPQILGRSDVGVVDAFLQAGARTCVACLWEVNAQDNPLPAAFAAALRQNGRRDAVAALAAAQRALVIAERSNPAPAKEQWAVPATTLGYMAYLPATG